MNRLNLLTDNTDAARNWRAIQSLRADACERDYRDSMRGQSERIAGPRVPAIAFARSVRS